MVRRPASQAFTLMELLVVISIIAVLAAMLLPAIHSVRSMARQMVCGQSLRQMQMANISYATEHDGSYVQIALRVASATTQSWKTNADYLEQLEQDSNTWPSKLLCAESLAVTGGTLSVTRSYGANIGTSASVSDRDFTFPVAQIRRSGDKIAFIDALDWWVNEIGANKYVGEAVVVGISMNAAYRHRGRANIAFYDGHVGSLPRADIDYTGLSATERTARQVAMWYPLSP